jgi:hypothetical protein
VVVLHKRAIQANLGKGASVIALQKKSALVAKDLWLQQHNFCYLGINPSHSIHPLSMSEAKSGCRRPRQNVASPCCKLRLLITLRRNDTTGQPSHCPLFADWRWRKNPFHTASTMKVQLSGQIVISYLSVG